MRGKRILILLFLTLVLFSCTEEARIENNESFLGSYIPEFDLVLTDSGHWEIGKSANINLPNLKYSVIVNIPSDSQDYHLRVMNNGNGQGVLYRNTVSSKAYFSVDKVSQVKKDYQEVISALSDNEEFINSERVCYTPNIYSDILSSQNGLKTRSLSRSSTNFGESHNSLSLGDTWEGAYVGHIKKDYNLSSLNEKENLSFVFQDDEFNVFVTEIVYKERKTEIDDLISEHIALFKKSFPLLKETFGSVSDIDNNGRINLVFHSSFVSSVLGYFCESDLNPNITSYTSNEGEILYFPVSFLLSNGGSNQAYTEEKEINRVKSDVATMLHEAQHLIFSSHRLLNEMPSINYSYLVWLTEGLSMCAEALLGYGDYGNLSVYVDYFLLFGHVDSLLNPWQGEMASYGNAFLFLRYLMEVYGKEEIVEGIYNLELVDKDGIFHYGNDDVTLFEKITNTRFSTLYADFAKMLITTGRGFTDDERYEVEVFNKSENKEGSTGGVCIKDRIDYLVRLSQNATNEPNLTKASVLLKTDNLYICPFSVIVTSWKEDSYGYYSGFDLSNTTFKISSQDSDLRMFAITD